MAHKDRRGCEPSGLASSRAGGMVHGPGGDSRPPHWRRQERWRRSRRRARWRTRRATGEVCAEVTPSTVELRNSVALRRFDRHSFRTVALTDRRAGGRSWGATRADFSLTLAGGLEVNSRAFSVNDAVVTRLARGGLRVELRLGLRPGGAAVPGLEVERAVEVYPGVAGFRSETLVRSALPLMVAGATLDEAPTGVGDARPSTRSVRAPTGASPTGPARSCRWATRTPGTWRDSRSRRPRAAAERPRPVGLARRTPGGRSSW